MSEDSDKKTTLSNLDQLLGVEEEKEGSRNAATGSPSGYTCPSEALAYRRFPPGKSFPTLKLSIPTIHKRSSVGKILTNNTDEEGVDFASRILASLVYALPLLDGLKYSSYLLQAYPSFGILLLPLTPLIKGYFSLGFLQIVVFFGLYFGVAQNRSLPRFVRYNASQAIVLDILLILPDVFMALFNGIDGPPTGGPMLEAKILLNNTTFLYVYLCTVYASGSSLLGKAVELPLVGGAAKNQTRE
eukprot:gene4091-5067_t